MKESAGCATMKIITTSLMLNDVGHNPTGAGMMENPQAGQCGPLMNSPFTAATTARYRHWSGLWRQNLFAMSTTTTKFKAIKLLIGFHLTATEKKAILQIVNNGWAYATNRPKTKSYTVKSAYQAGSEYIYDIRIGTKATHSIGQAPTWQYNSVKIKTIS